MTHELSATQAIFLDLFIWKGSRFKLLGAFDTKTYQKPMNRHRYTPYCTAAPEHTKLSVVHTELRRYQAEQRAGRLYHDRHSIAGAIEHAGTPKLVSPTGF